ncbi:hypothetical protein ABPG77_005380 [Micractinium sp. CCAP 211/92]
MATEGVKSGVFVVRFFQMIFAIVAFTTALDYDGLSRIKFLMFTGITGFILPLAFMIAYTVGIGAARGIVEFVIDVIWTVFWIVSASLATALLNDDSIVASSKLKASVAFSWLSWFLWNLSINFSARRLRGCGRKSDPAPGAPTGSIPNSSANVV